MLELLVNGCCYYIRTIDAGLAGEGDIILYIPLGKETGIKDVQSVNNQVSDGKYVQGGKIVIVKDGKKFNAAGQQVK